jgi:hypothetical protein
MLAAVPETAADINHDLAAGEDDIGCSPDLGQ